MKHNNFYNKNLHSNAHKLRKSMTKAEACIWKYVLKGKNLGVIFNRQRPIGPYIVDFV
jgi:very-short-patch-repair endonuclease